MTEHRSPTTGHVAMLATPGMGHLIPMAELAKRLAARHGFTATIITFATTDSATQRAFLASLPPAISAASLPAVSLSDIPPTAAIETLMSVECARSIPALTALLEQLKAENAVVAFVTDLFGPDAFAAAEAVGVDPYLFFPSNLLLLSLLLHLPEMDKEMNCEFRELEQPVRLPGCVPFPGSEVVFPLQDRKNECYKWMIHHGKNYRKAKAILVNTFDAIEPGAARILRHPEDDRPPVYPIGPLLNTAAKSPSSADNECIKWLDGQPKKSVIFVSFGSGGVLTSRQMRELALGLELSEQRFLWVVRSPSDAGASYINYYDAKSKEDPFPFLPEGFVDRTSGRALVVPSWAPQVAVLAHAATGGFFTHCGWNSVLESVVHGVPMVAWPLYAEQRQNAVMLVDGMGAALRPPAGKDGIIENDEIAKVAKDLIAGEGGAKVRKTVEELSAAAAEALKNGGSSVAALDEVVASWRQP